jgi:hypothetical protein
MKNRLSLGLALTVLLAGQAQGVHYLQAKYGQEFTLYFSIFDSNLPHAFYQTAPAADDMSIRKDGGDRARATNAVTDLDHVMKLVLTATEMTAGVVTVDANDETSPKLYGDDTWIIYTYGNASATHAFDLDSATVTPGADSITAAVIASNALTSDELATSFIDEIENDLINNNNTKHSLAYYIKRASGGEPVDVEPDATAQAGGTANTIVLEAASSSTTNAYVPMLVELTSGTGAPATATIIAYNGTTKVATVDRNWPGSYPNATTHYKLTASSSSSLAHTGLAQTGGAASITLSTEAPSTSGITGWVVLLSGTGSPDTQEISAYDGATKVLTVASWTGASPDGTTYYALVPTGNIASDTSEPTGGLTIADVQTALTTQGLTTTRAGYLDNINNALLTELGLSEIGDKVQTDMDANSVLANGTYGLSALETLVDDLESRLTATRAGYLDTVNDWADGQRLDLLLDAILADTAALDTANELRTLLTGGTNALLTTADLPTNFGSLDINASGQVDIYQIENVDATTQLGSVTMSVDASDLLDALIAGHTGPGTVGQAIGLIPALR